MIKRLFSCAFLLLVTYLCCGALKAGVVIYPQPGDLPASKHYEVSILLDGDWRTSYVNFDAARVKGQGATDERGKSFSWTTFQTKDPVQIRVKRFGGKFNSVALRPSRYGLETKRIDEHTVQFRISPGQKVSVEFDTEINPSCYTGPPHGIPCVKHILMLFADRQTEGTAMDGVLKSDVFRVEPGRHEVVQSVEGGDGELSAGKSNLGDVGGKSVVLFRPGVYDIGYWQVPNSVKQIHIEGGAVVFGAIDVIPQGRDPFYDARTIDQVYRKGWYKEKLRESFKLTGPGVLSGAKLPWHLKKDFSYTENDDWWAHVRLVQLAVENVVVEDVTLVNSPYWVLGWINDGDSRVKGRLERFKMVGAWTYNNDGLPNPSGSGSRIGEAFIHANDDAFKIYNSGSRIENCVVWQGNNGAVFQLGWFPKSVRDVQVSNIDVIHFENWYGVNLPNRALFNYANSEGQGVIADIGFSDVRVDGPILRLFGWHCGKGQEVRGLRFERLSVPGGMGIGKLGAPGRNYFHGALRDFRFVDFQLGAQMVTTPEQGWFDFSGGAGSGFTFEVEP